MKKKISIVLVMVLAAVSLFAVPNNRNAAATVNLIRNTVITNADLNSQMQMLGASEEQALDVLDIMINDEVFLQGAERDGVTVTDAQVDALYAQQKNAYEQQAGAAMTDEQFEQIVNQAYGSVDAYKETIKNQYILQTYLMQEKGEELNNGNYAPAASDVETFYKRNATSFTQAENVKFAQIYMAKTAPCSVSLRTSRAESSHSRLPSTSIRRMRRARPMVASWAGSAATTTSFASCGVTTSSTPSFRFRLVRPATSSSL